MSSNISETITKIVKNLNDSTVVLDDIKSLIYKLIEYIKKYMKDRIRNLNITDTDRLFDKFEKFMNGFFTELFEQNKPALEIEAVENYEQKLKNENKIYTQKIDDDKQILSNLYQNYKDLEVKNIFHNIDLSDEIRKLFNVNITTIPYNEYIERLTDVYSNKLKSFATNVMIKTANKKRLDIFQGLKQNLQPSKDLTNSYDILKLITYSVILYYQQMIYLRKKYDELQEKKKKEV